MVTLNNILIGTLLLIIGVPIIRYLLTPTDIYEPPTGTLPVPMQVGKSKLNQSKTGDASMSTEFKRRRAIIGSNSCGIRPKFSHSGSTNGSLETYCLSGMCPTFVSAKSCPEELIYDAENADDDFCEVLDANGGNLQLDLGNVSTRVCGV
jgi:hypothetical protein